MPSRRRMEGLLRPKVARLLWSVRALRSSRVGVISRSTKSNSGQMAGTSRCNSSISSVESSGRTVSARTTRGAVSSSASSSSSIHGVVMFLPQHYLQIGLETPSALQWSRPGLCLISYSKSTSVSIHRVKIPSGRLQVLSHFKL